MSSRRARNLVRRHPLRAYDAVHLATALDLQAAAGEPVTFVAADGPSAAESTYESSTRKSDGRPYLAPQLDRFHTLTRHDASGFVVYHASGQVARLSGRQAHEFTGDQEMFSSDTDLLMLPDLLYNSLSLPSASAYGHFVVPRLNTFGSQTSGAQIAKFWIVERAPNES